MRRAVLAGLEARHDERRQALEELAPGERDVTVLGELARDGDRLLAELGVLAVLEDDADPVAVLGERLSERAARIALEEVALGLGVDFGPLAGSGQAGQMTETEKWEAFRKAKENAETVDVTARRRSLSEPPAEYRAADATALTDLGEPETQKEKRRKKEAADAKKSSDWWKLF